MNTLPRHRTPGPALRLAPVLTAIAVLCQIALGGCTSLLGRFATGAPRPAGFTGALFFLLIASAAPGL